MVFTSSPALTDHDLWKRALHPENRGLGICRGLAPARPSGGEIVTTAEIADLFAQACIRLGLTTAAVTHEAMGRRIDRVSFVADGGPFPSSAARDYLSALFDLRDEFGARGEPWFRLTVEFTAGEGAVVVVDTETEPLTEALRMPGTFVSDLIDYPRRPDQVPPWMKQSLARVGAWDLEADVPAFTNRGVPTGKPVAR